MTATTMLTQERLLPFLANDSVPLPTFDLTLVRNHMMRRHELDAASADTAEVEYRKYLQKCKANPGQSIVPGHIADKFWHAHILHTRLYTEHCRQYLGYYLHHTPKVMPVDVPCALGECFCNGDGIQREGEPANGGGVNLKAMFGPTESCG